MKKIFFIFLVTFFPNFVYANIFTKTQIWNIWFQYVTYDISSEVYEINAVISHEDVSPLSELALSQNALTAINGVFFCPADYSQCNGNNYTINERFIDGEDLSFYDNTGDRWVFWWTEAGFPILHQTGKIRENEREYIYEGLGNFPILISDGKNMLEHYHDVWLYDNKMRFPAYRHFICSNKDKTQIIFGRSSPTSLDNLTPSLYKIWCWDALNLDAWNSAQLLYNGRYIAQWPRNILDGFTISHKDVNVLELETKLNTLFQQVEKQYRRYPKRIAIERLNGFILVIPKLRTEIYEKYSEDITNEHGEIIWYTTEITDLAELKRIYMINGLEVRIKKLKNSLEN